MRSWIPILVATCALALAVFSGCEHDCSYDAVCDAFEAAADERSDDCGYGGGDYIVIFDCPYSGPGPGSEIVCGSVYACIDALDNDQVDCDGLSGLSLASCSSYTE